MLDSEQSDDCIGFTMMWVFFINLCTFFITIWSIKNALIFNFKGRELNLVRTLRIQNLQ